MLLNDTGFVECAQALAKMMRGKSESVAEQVQFGLLAATCRQPKPEEIQRLVELFHQVEEESNADIAIQSVASVLLNLDEIIMK